MAGHDHDHDRYWSPAAEAGREERPHVVAREEGNVPEWDRSVVVFEPGVPRFLGWYLVLAATVLRQGEYCVAEYPRNRLDWQRPKVEGCLACYQSKAH